MLSGGGILKHKKKNTGNHNKANSEQTVENDDSDDINIDFTSIKKATTKAYNSVKKFTTHKNSKIIIAWTLIALLILISSWYRLYPVNLPVTEDWVRSSLETNIKNQFIAEQQKNNPTLPEATLRANANKQYEEYYKANKQAIDKQIKDNAVQFKNQLQNDAGQTYLLAIDPYLWYSYAKWYEKTGFYGNEIVDGEERFTLRNGRIGFKANQVLASMPIVWTQNVIKIFNPDQDIFSTSFFMPILLIGLSIIPAFFLGRKFGGNTGGFFAAFIFVLTPSILGRTTAGFSDTDAYTFFFPFLLIWLFLISIESKNIVKGSIVAALCSLVMIFFRYLWSGWWFTYDLLLGLAVVFAAYKIIKRLVEKRKLNIKKSFVLVKPEAIFIGAFILGILLFSVLAGLFLKIDIGNDIKGFVEGPIEPLNFILGFKGAAEGISVGQGLNYPLWPNVLTTVAELNAGSVDGVISGGGGSWLFYLSIFGAVLLFFKKKDGKNYPLYGIILGIWMVSTFYAGLIGIRFIALFAPVVAFGFAGLVGAFTGERMKAMAKKMKLEPGIVKMVIVVIFLLFLVVPVPGLPQMTRTADAVAKNEVPSFDDTWNAALTTIKNSSDKAIISSWWDFGHWFEAMSERSVTFDGGDQGKRIHWIGKSLLTDDENETIDILKMLNCGQEESYNLLEKTLKDKLKTTRLMKEIIKLDKEDAKDRLVEEGLTDEEADAVLALSHCDDIIDMYYVTSEDMVGKSGVWGHFGSWNFSKAYMYYKLSNEPLNKAIKEAKDLLGYDEETAKTLYFEAQKIKTGENSEGNANNWISPWPNYITGSPVTCDIGENKTALGCTYNIGLGRHGNVNNVLYRGIINLTNPEKSVLILQGVNPTTRQLLGQNSVSPNAVVIAEEKGMTRYETQTPGFPYDILVFKDSQGNYKTLITHPLLTESTFTKLFYLDGLYMNHFKKVFDQRNFRGSRIIVWKVEP